MSKAMKKYAENRIANLRKQMNGLAEGAKDECLAAIDELNTLINDMEAEETEYTTKDVLDAAISKMEEKLSALQENKETETENKIKMKENYLKSENALHDFAEAIRNSNNAAAFTKKWSEKLSANGISGTVVFPETVLGMIEDAWEKKSWLNGLKNTGAKAYRVRYNSTAQTNANARAKGHAGGGAAKDVQTIAFGNKLVTPQMIYKIQKLDNITEFNDDGSLVRYIVEELTTQWVYEVQRAILVGDGRQDNATDKISSIESILRASTDTFVTVAQNDGSTANIKQLRALRDTLSDNAGEVVAFMSRSYLTGLAEHLYASGGSLRYSSDAEIAAQIGVDRIITTGVMGNNAEAIILNMAGYVTVGKFVPEMSNWEDFDHNLDCYRLEAPFGGAMEMPLGAAVLTPAAS